MNDIQEALAKLDPTVEDHWTADGLPRTDAVSDAAGRTVTRHEISDAAPNFTREAALQAATEDPGDGNEDTAESDPNDAGEGSNAGEDAAPESNSGLFGGGEPKTPKKQRNEPKRRGPIVEHAEDIDAMCVADANNVSDAEGLRRYTAIGDAITQLEAQQGKLAAYIKRLSQARSRYMRFAPDDRYDHVKDQQNRMNYIKASQEDRRKRFASMRPPGVRTDPRQPAERAQQVRKPVPPIFPPI